MVEKLGKYSNKTRTLEDLQKLLVMVPKGLPIRAPRGRRLRRITQDQAVEIGVAYQEGATQAELAKHFGVNRTTVSDTLVKSGVRHRYRVVDEAIVASAVALYKVGHSLAAIGEQLGVSYGTVLTALMKAGVVMRDSQGRERS
jgi:DNA-directed RNA polymerase specialized sigma24 family protein